MTAIKTWLEAHQQTIQVLGTWSLVMLAITLVALPVAVARMPADYFVSARRDRAYAAGRPLLNAVIAIVKNAVGIVIIIVGLALLILPGQGIITILIGVSLTNFPGKFAIERWMARQPGVSHTLNWIRAKFGKPPFAVGQPKTVG